MPKKVKEIASFINGEVVGDGEVIVKGVSGINEARDGDISFILSPKYEGLIDHTKASCIVVPKAIKRQSNKPLIKVDEPSITLSKVIEFIFPERIPHPRGIHQSAIVSKKATLGANVALGPYVVIEDGASVGDETIIYPFSYIGKNTNIGKKCLIYPNVTIREEISIGSRVIIHPGAVIGGDGFGYDTKPDGTHMKIPQLGTVIIEDDVEIGSCATIDRARFDKTIIGRGTKIDNLVQVAHNVIIGPNCIFAGQAGVSGSCEFGRNVVLAGQAGIADHVKLGDFVTVTAKSGVSKSYPSNTTLLGIPARPLKRYKAVFGSLSLLPKLLERVRKLEAKIKELESGKTKDD